MVACTYSDNSNPGPTETENEKKFMASGHPESCANV